jgi:L-threonylcarbamoyladenylate synthase
VTAALIRDAGQAARILLDGGLVVLPTETVYGLAGRADLPDTVARIYSTKGRPVGHPLIVHVADGAQAMAGAWAASANPLALKLTEKFWPGPLTVVVPRGPRSGDNVTGGQDTVALRVPSHPLTREVLQCMDELDPAGAPHGVAAPSANRFGHVSPTTSAHAMSELGELLRDTDAILDGGTCAFGVESTIVDCSGTEPAILRPGGVSAEDIAEACGVSVASLRDTDSGIRVPGSLPSHYAPTATVILEPDLLAAEAVLAAMLESGMPAHLQGFLALADVPTPEGVLRLAAPQTNADYARDLYAALRAADDQGLSLVVAIPPADESGMGAAVIDRLRRAAAPR